MLIALVLLSTTIAPGTPQTEETSELRLPDGYRLGTVVGFCANGDVLASGYKNLSGSCRERSFWRIDENNSPSLLHAESYNPEKTTRYTHFSMSPGGKLLALRSRPSSGTRLAASDTGEPVEVANPPIVDWIVWDLESGEQGVLPQGLEGGAWLDDDHLVVTDKLGPEWALARSSLYVLDVNSMSIEQTIPTGAGAIFGLESVSPGVIAYHVGCDPKDPQPYNAKFLAFQAALALGPVWPAVAGSIVDYLVRTAPRPGYRRDDRTPDADDFDANAPVIPIESPFMAYGELRLLDLRDPEHPKTRVLMELLRDQASWTVSPDGRFVGYNRIQSLDKGGYFVVYDTVANRWKPVGPWGPHPYWHPKRNKVLVATSYKPRQWSQIDEVALLGEWALESELVLDRVVGRLRPAKDPPRVSTRSQQSRPESEWEAYTRQFIRTYRLDDEQAQRASSILRDCQERANAYLSAHKDQLEQLRQRVALTVDGDPRQRLDVLNALGRERSELLRPLDEIFAKQLKPRLEKLPTSAQRRAAEEREKATSKPVKAGDTQP